MLAALKIFDLEDYFSVKVTADDIINSKPNPEIYIRTAKLLNSQAQDCIVFEDATLGVKAAKCAGMYCVGFTGLSKHSQNLKKADLVINNFNEVNYEFFLDSRI